MTQVAIAKRASSTPLALLVTIGVLSVMLGALAAVLPWWFFVAFLLLPMLLAVAVFSPEYGLVFLVLMISGLIPDGLMPSISVGPGKILGTDLAILGLCLVSLIKANSISGSGYMNGLWAWLRPIFLFFALTAIAVCSGAFIYGAPLKDVLTEARCQIHWLIALVTIYLTTDQKTLRTVIWGLIFVGVLLSMAVVIQFLTGVAIIQNARVESLVSGATHYQDITRSTAGGAIYLVLFPIFYILARLLTKSINSLAAVIILAVLAAGVVVSFGRAIWITTAIGALALAYLLRGPRGLLQILIALVVGVALALGGLSVAKPQVIAAAYERIVSTAGEGAHNSSLGWRIEEARYAIQKVSSHPIFGIGFGTPYKPRLDPLADWSQVRYIHNSYLGLWMKLGILGLAAAVWMILIVLSKAHRLFAEARLQEHRALAATILVAFGVPVITSFTQPEWLVSTGISFYALMVGLLIACQKHIFLEAGR